MARSVCKCSATSFSCFIDRSRNSSMAMIRVVRRAAQVYDAAQEAAKRASRAGPRHLATAGCWSWLLRQLAAGYGVRSTYAGLASVRWAVQPGRLTPTADCLELLIRELGPLHRSQAHMLPQARPTAPPLTRLRCVIQNSNRILSSQITHVLSSLFVSFTLMCDTSSHLRSLCPLALPSHGASRATH